MPDQPMERDDFLAMRLNKFLDRLASTWGIPPWRELVSIAFWAGVEAEMDSCDLEQSAVVEKYWNEFRANIKFLREKDQLARTTQILEKDGTQP